MRNIRSLRLAGRNQTGAAMLRIIRTRPLPLLPMLRSRPARTWRTARMPPSTGRRRPILPIAASRWWLVSNASPGGIVYLYYQNVAQSLYFVVDKSTFGTDEVKDMLASPSAGNYQDCFWVILEGFTPNQLGTTPLSIAGTLQSFADIDSITQDGSPLFENPAAPDSPSESGLRSISNSSPPATFQPAPVRSCQKTVTANITVGGTFLTATADFELIAGADPYFTNVDLNNNAFYLSQHLRVFSAADGDVILGSTTFSSDQNDSIQRLLNQLNTNDAYTVPSSSDPLNSLPGQSGYETADSSVTPLRTVPARKTIILPSPACVWQDAGGASAPGRARVLSAFCSAIL